MKIATTTTPVITSYVEMFGDRLRDLRKKKKVSAREMSIDLGQNPGYINGIENHKTMPQFGSFFEICQYLEVSPSYFLSIYENNSDSRKKHELNQIVDELSEKQLDALYVLMKGLVE